MNNFNQDLTGKQDIPQAKQLMETLHKTIKIAWKNDNKIKQANIDKWLDNFTGEALLYEKISTCTDYAEREKQLALFLLCNFVYYNESEIKHLAKLMFKKYIHSFCESENKQSISNEEILKLVEENTTFTYLGNIGESSSFLLYHFRQVNNLSRTVFADKFNAKNIVFIDDFSITGSQITKYLPSKLYSLGKNKKFYVILMVATQEAIQALEKLNITVLACIVLDESATTFSDNSMVFEKYNDTCKIEAQKMCEYYGERIKTQERGMTSLGFGDNNGHLFGSFYNTPNNTLPIFWSDLNNWVPLFTRYNKEYDESKINLGGHYV